MVDFSLKKARNNWKNSRGTSPSKSKEPTSPIKSTSKQAKKNPYSDMKVSPEYSQLPTINAKEKNKVATSMQRRLSVHNPNYVPPKLDYSIPLPSMSIEPLQQNGKIKTTIDNKKSRQERAGPVKAGLPERSHLRGETLKTPTSSVPPAIMNPESLREILLDPNFNAKTFVHDALGDAGALEIDRFTSNLSDLASEVQEEAKENINKSYREILTVNTDLGVANLELKQLRSNIEELNEMMQQFLIMAERRLQAEEKVTHPQSQSTSSSSMGLLPPMRAGSVSANKRDRSSVAILEKIWDNQMTTLFKNVEGAQKYITPSEGRHVLLEMGNWVELNTATLKPLQNVHIFILNDMVLVAARPRDKQKELVVSQCAHMRDVAVVPEGVSNNRLSFSFGNSTKCLYQCREPREGMRLLNVVRRAKDDLRDIFQAEEENARRIQQSFTYLQSTQQTPGREGTKSPVKSSRRSIGSLTPSRGGDTMDSYLLQTITMSMHSRTRSRDMSSLSQRLKMLDDGIEEIDIELGRLKFDKAVDALNDMESQLNKIADQAKNEDLMLHSLIALKIGQRRESVSSKLSQTILTTSEISRLTFAVKNMIKLGLEEEGLDLYLQNRSNLIEDLILQIGSFDNPTNYLTQIAVIRFQTIKKTVINFQDIFQNAADKFSSILVNWCKEEADEHFKLIDKQLLNDEILSPTSIRSSRKQIDGLKSVGIDFVYKLDEFIKTHSEKIR